MLENATSKNLSNIEDEFLFKPCCLLTVMKSNKKGFLANSFVAQRNPTPFM